MEFGILGPLEVRHGDEQIPVPGTKQRALLALLLIHANETLSTDRLIDELWGERPPESGPSAVQVRISQLRKTLRSGELTEVGPALETRSRGYVLEVAPERLDALRFVSLADFGEAQLASGDPATAAAKLREALALWRGPALADFAGEPFAAAASARLEEQRTAALEARIDADLALGRHASLIGELQQLVREHPLNEHLRAQLMLALYRSGRQAEALETYRDARATLIDELGIEPGERLRQLEGSILRHDPSLDPVASPAPNHRVPAPPQPDIAPPVRSRRRSRALVGVATAMVVLLVTSIAVVGLRPHSHVGSNGDAVSVLDPVTGRTVDTIPIVAPTAVADGLGAIWVVSSADGSVSRIDPATDTVTQTTPVGGQPSGLLVADGSVWTASPLDGSVSRLDANGQPVDSFAAGKGPSALAFDGSSLWALSATEATLTRIDPATDRVSETIALPARGASIAASDGVLWVTAQDAPGVWRIDPATDAITPLQGFGTSTGAVAAAGAWVWVADPLDGTLWRYSGDGAPNIVVPVGALPGAVAVAGADVWVTNEGSGTITAVDAETGRWRTVDLIAGARPTGVAIDHGSLWVASRAVGDVHRGGTLRLVSATGCFNIDPAVSGEIPCAESLSVTSDGLLAFEHVSGGEGLRLVPDLATSVPPGGGATTYAFDVRPGIQYSDGTPLRAADFRWALERSFQMGRDGGSFDAVLGAKACHTRGAVCDLSAGITVSGDSITFHLAKPDPDFRFKLVRLFPVPPGTPAHNTGRHPVPGTGPYRIEELTHDRMTLVRNPEFHEWSAAAQPAGYPDRIEWTFGGSPNAAVSAIESDRADWSMDPPPPDRLFEIDTRFHDQLHTTPGSGSYFLFMNTRRAPFDDPRVRRALGLALDPIAAVQQIGGGAYGLPACGFIPPDIAGSSRCPAASSAPAPTAAARLKRATRLLRGVPRPFAEVPVFVSTLNGVNFAELGRYVVSVLHDLGIPARLHVQSVLDYFRNGEGKDEQYLGVGYWAADYPSASDFLPLVSCSSITTGQAPNNTNWSNFCDPRIDAAAQLALVDEAAGASADAGAQWARMEALISSDAPVVPLVVPREVDLVSSRVGDVVVHPLMGLLLSQLWVR